MKAGGWSFLGLVLFFVAGAADLHAQKPPYDVFPPAEPPYYRVRYDASTKQGELTFPVNYTLWIPKDVKTLRGVIVHQHGCGEGSCKSGLTGAYDLHWQALAKKHDCALLSPSYEQPEKAECQLWCDPRNGSDAAFQKCLVDLGKKSGHPELAEVPWALWGHSGGGHWAGGMVLLHPERVAAAWLRSGVPLLKADPKRDGIKAYTLPGAALKVPVMCNLGTKEGVTVKDDRFAGVWPANEAFFNEVRGKGGLIGVAVDPLTSHECGNQRYLAIPWLDACLSARLPKAAKESLRDMPTDKAWLAALTGGEAVPAGKYKGEALKAAWLPNEALAKAWMEYIKDTKVTDSTPPPAPTNVRVQGNKLTWEAEADLESGLASFIIERDGQFHANVPEQGKNPFGRPIFQNLQYSDTPAQPLVTMQFTDTKAEQAKKHTYRVIAVNTVGVKSKPSAEATKADEAPKPKDGVHTEGLQKTVKVFILAGQSNMEGKAPNTLLDHQATDPKTKDLFAHLRKDDKWIVREDVFIKFLDRKGPLTIGYGSPGRTGVELEFGTVMGDHFKEPVLLIKTAWGGHSLYKHFRSPSAGYPAAEVLDKELKQAQDRVKQNNEKNKKNDPLPTMDDIRKEYGSSYRKMMAEVKDVMDNSGTLFPALKGKKLEVAGFVWFQGWNDQYGAQDEYESNMKHFINDIRKDLKTPKLPFVIGVMGQNGSKPASGAMLTIQKAQLAMNDVPDFKGNVQAIRTDVLVDKAAEELYPTWQKNVEQWKLVGGDQPYHYLGSAIWFNRIGKAMGEAMLELLKDHQ